MQNNKEDGNRRVVICPGESITEEDTTITADEEGRLTITAPGGWDGSPRTDHALPRQVMRRGEPVTLPAQISIGRTEVQDGQSVHVTTIYQAGSLPGNVAANEATVLAPMS